MGQVEMDERALTHHEIQLVNLEPYSLYFYRVDDDAVAQFHTAAPATQTNFRFVVFGDTREGVSIHKAIINRILEVAPDFVIHTGDMVEAGNCVPCWDDFFRVEAPLLRSAPFYPTLGNHEDDQSPSAQASYFDIFHLPDIERWYAFDYGKARFISLKVDGYPIGIYYPDQEQLDWLEDQLANNTQPWTFIFFHWGVFTSRSEDFLEIGMRIRLVPLFERYGVNVVFMGHNHGYERIKVNGITYITTAGGGASLYEMTVPEPGSQVAVSEYHFVMISMKGDHLEGQTINNHGKILDQFELSPSR
jgi:predicted phosphodiesterase